MPDVTEVPKLSRFDHTRAQAAEKATMTLCIELLLSAGQQIGRCMSLLVPALAGSLGAKINKAQVSAGLAGVIADLQEIVSELGE